MVNWPAKLWQMISGVPMPSHYSNLFLNVGASRNFEVQSTPIGLVICGIGKTS